MNFVEFLEKRIEEVEKEISTIENQLDQIEDLDSDEYETLNIELVVANSSYRELLHIKEKIDDGRITSLK